jgi:ankyrin repeat protein
MSINPAFCRITNLEKVTTMRFKTNLLTALTLSVSCFALPAFADNPMVEEDFWEEHTLATVQAAIAEGHSVTDITANGYTPLIRALRGEASIETVDYLIAQGADIERIGHDDRPAIFWAARYGNLDMVQHIVELGADLTVLDDSARNALGYAARSQPDQAVYAYLIDQGIDPNFADDDGENAALTAAYENPHLDIVVYLSGVSDLSGHNNTGSDAFMLAASRNSNLDVVKAMFAITADAHAVDSEDGSDALLLAAYRNETLETFDFLLDHGFSLDARTTDGRDAVAIAAVRNSPEVISHLLAVGADATVVDANGNTALLAAADRDRDGAEEIIAILVAAGADAAAANADGVNGLIAAARTGHSLETLKVFVDGGADLDAVDDQKMSALMYLALKGTDAAAVELLIDAGADVSLGDDFGDTAADFIADNEALAGTEAAAHLMHAH